jgi:hypothetical protein
LHWWQLDYLLCPSSVLTLRSQWELAELELDGVLRPTDTDMGTDTHTATAILHIATIGRTTAIILGGHTTTDTVITATTVIIATISTKLT